MEKEKLIEDLAKNIKQVFNEEFNALKPMNVTTITPNDVFNRWFNTTKNVHTEDLIATMCQRLTQAGYKCYPVSKIEIENPYLVKDEDVVDVCYEKKPTNISASYDINTVVFAGA